MKKQAHLKRNSVIGNTRVQVHLNKGFNAWKNLCRGKTFNVNKGDKCR